MAALHLRSSETSVNVYQTAQRHMPEDMNTKQTAVFVCRKKTIRVLLFLLQIILH
jgi:hypothetical protein